MAMIPHQFNPSEVDPSSGTGLDPDFTGWHPAAIIDSEMKDTKAGTGQYLQLTYEVTAGKFKGRKLWQRLNLVNQNSTAVDIAYRDLSAVCHAVGHLSQLVDSQQLHNKPLMVNVIYKPPSAQNQYGGNEVGGVQPATQGAATPQAEAPVAAAAQATTPTPRASAGGSVPPWQKRAG